jgi:hypothetical protein
MWVGAGTNARGRAEYLARLDFTGYSHLPRLCLMFFRYILYLHTLNLFQMQFEFELLNR